MQYSNPHFPFSAGLNLVGSTPTKIGLFKNLAFVSLGGNNLRGPLPKEIFSHTQMYHMVIQNLLLTGSLSTCIGLLTGLDIMFLLALALLRMLHTWKLHKGNKPCIVKLSALLEKCMQHPNAT